MRIFLSGRYTLRGAQYLLHRLRMGLPLVEKLLGITLVIGILIFGSLAWRATQPYERYVLKQYLLAEAMPFLSDSAVAHFREPNGQVVSVPYALIANAPKVQAKVQGIALRCIRAAKQASIVALGILGLLGLGLARLGRKQYQDTSISGDSVVAEKVLRTIILRQGRYSSLRLASLPLPQGIECGHILLHGTTGTGKSTAIKALLDTLRARGDRAVIFDKGCTYFEELSRPEDILLNPLDTRSRAWDLWADCRDAADFDTLAAAQIPLPVGTHDPFWIQAARTVLSTVTYRMRKEPDRSTEKLLERCLSSDTRLLQEYLQGTVAEALVSDKIEKAALSIKAVLATYLKSFHSLGNTNASFSLRSWVEDDSASNWLFITSRGDRHETLKPLISTWLDIAVNTLLSLSPNPQRRIWFILDELASLQPLPSLLASLAESRKFGGCVLIGLQSIAQLEKIYGVAGAKEISSLLNTRMFFRQPDPVIAEWSAHNLGERITIEAREGASMGTGALQANDTLHHSERRKPVVSFSEIVQLPNLEAYLRLPGKYPITKVTFIPIKRSKHQAGYVPLLPSENKEEKDENIHPPSYADDLPPLPVSSES